MDSWVVLLAAAVGAVPGLVTARWAIAATDRTRRDDLVKAAVAGLLSNAAAVALYTGLLGAPATRRSVRFRPAILHTYVTRSQEQLQALLTAKAAFDLVIDHAGMHAAADALLEAVNEQIALSAGTGAIAQSERDAASEAFRQARLNLVREARRALPGLVQDRRAGWRRRSRSRK